MGMKKLVKKINNNIMDKSIILIRDYIGLYAPFILFILGLFLLRKKSHYLLFFIIGNIFNNLLNVMLKYMIKEPRPDNENKSIEIALIHGKHIGIDKFGMPSGHAQNCGFLLAFITYVSKSAFVSGLFLIISFISLLQRYIYKNHTLNQLFVGFILGLVCGSITYYIANKYIVGNIKNKKDDYAPK
jgi:dolichyldiphosphatase